MAFNPNSIIQAQQASSQNTFNFLNKVSTRLANFQKAKNAKEAEIVTEVQKNNVDFMNEFAKQPKSSTVGFNLAAEGFVRERAARQEQLYREAFGANGNAQKRADYNSQIMKDKQALSTIGQWMVLGNNSNKALNENAIASEQDISLGAFVRGNDLNKMSFQEKMSNSKFTNYYINELQDGNIELKGFESTDNYNKYLAGKQGGIPEQDLSALYANRNLTGDIAAHTNGQAWYTQIQEDDLLSNKLGSMWSNKNPAIGLSTLFNEKTQTRKIWNEDKKQYETSTYKGYNTEQIKRDLTGKYVGRLNPLVRSADFGKTWDQLYKGGYLRNSKGEQLEEGQTAWSTVRKVNVMSLDEFGEQFGDLNNDGKVTEADKDMYVNNMRDVARQGLANYFAETVAPQGMERTSTDVTQVKPNDGRNPTPLSEAQQIERQTYTPVKEQIDNSSLENVLISQDGPSLGEALVLEYESYPQSVFRSDAPKFFRVEGTAAFDKYREQLDPKVQLGNISQGSLVAFVEKMSGGEFPKVNYELIEIADAQELDFISKMKDDDTIDIGGKKLNKKQYISRILKKGSGVPIDNI